MRILYLLLLLFLAGCHHSTWQHTSIRNGNDRYDMSKLTCPPYNETNGIELEITRLEKEIHAYINVHHLQLPKNKDDERATTLIISTNCSTRTFIIPLLEGRQRARLTDTCFEYLLQHLELKPSVTLSSGHFSETLDASNFGRHYDTLLRKPSFIQPRSMISLELF
ncbi:MAG: hypothetical protein P0S93_05075 [Candidatus Neptunochlamydia sp.]|nr:hypothetical protein [Candidatus Neptunochlamydia sp.]